MYLYRDLKVGLLENEYYTKMKLANKLSIKVSDINNLKLFKRSIDARDKNDIFYICSFTFESKRNIKHKNIKIVDEEFIHPAIKEESINLEYRPVVVGFGPSGMFAALYLAKKGLKPIVIEQGSSVEKRAEIVDTFFRTGKLNIRCNVAFGEGGAGTFSDGKLNTNNSDPKIRLILNEMVNHGAPEEIMVDAKPHIGTDKLIDTVRNIRKEIIRLGGEVLFDTTFKSINLENNQIKSIVVENENKTRIIETNALFLGIGHSSKETIEYLDTIIKLSQKDFAVGFRIQHDQKFINKSQYGRFYSDFKLPAASYKLITHLDNGRTVFSFCNCPGGVVVNSSSENDKVVCNGMSYHDRGGKYSNCAILVNVKTDDIGSSDPLAAVRYVEEIEQKAYLLNKDNILTVQSTMNFINGVKKIEEDPKFDTIVRYKMGLLNGVLPPLIEQSLIAGLVSFNNRIKGFTKDSYLFGVETRSSSPIRMDRNRDYQSVSLNNLYVIGEGAGYAGGIMTSAIDGYNAAESFVNKIKEENV